MYVLTIAAPTDSAKRHARRDQGDRPDAPAPRHPRTSRSKEANQCLPHHDPHGGVCYPFALVFVERRRCKHTYIDGQRLVSTGTGRGLVGPDQVVLLVITTLTIYSFSVVSHIRR